MLNEEKKGPSVFFERRGPKAVAAIVLILASSFGGGFLSGRLSSGKVEVEELRDFNSKYPFINPLLDVEMGDQLSDAKANEAKRRINDFIKERDDGEKGKVEVSVYYRDLNNGPWFGIDEKEAFIPASLLKLPLLIAYLKMAERDPSILDKELPCDSDMCVNDNQVAFLPDKQIELGKSYKVIDLLERMIAYSDNRAKNVLLLEVDQEFISRVFLDLGVPLPSIEKSADFISTKQYASFFRILYNASYLNRDMSNLALSILSKSNFDIGLAAGLPEGVILADKFGERRVIAKDTIYQLHDCGIVYHPQKPYLLCIMTRGWRSYDELADYIAGISGIVYKSINE